MVRQETFEDAPDMTPRPTSQSERSRSRSLTARRTSTTSTLREVAADSPVLAVPDGVREEAEKDQGTPETADEKAAAAAQRISVTEDMDDVSLEEGDFHSPIPRPLRVPTKGFW